jgi:hypothetical protein
VYDQREIALYNSRTEYQKGIITKEKEAEKTDYFSRNNVLNCKR